MRILLAALLIILFGMMLGPLLWGWIREWREWRKPEEEKLLNWIGVCPACRQKPLAHQLRLLATADITPNDLLAVLERHEWSEAARYQQGAPGVAAFVLRCPAVEACCVLVENREDGTWVKREVLPPDESPRAWAAAATTGVELPAIAGRG